MSQKFYTTQERTKLENSIQNCSDMLQNALKSVKFRKAESTQFHNLIDFLLAEGRVTKDEVKRFVTKKILADAKSNASDFIHSLCFEGKILKRTVSEITDEQKFTYYLYNKEYNYFEFKGWGSAFESTDNMLESMLGNPELWEITDYSIEDRPWSK